MPLTGLSTLKAVPQTGARLESFGCWLLERLGAA